MLERVAVRSVLPGYTSIDARRALDGLPRTGYEVVIKALRYRTAPHLAALCEFEEERLTLQIPVPFRPFREPVVYAARRQRGDGRCPSGNTNTIAASGANSSGHAAESHSTAHRPPGRAAGRSRTA